MFFAEYDNAARRLRYVNCGHVAGFLIRSDRRVERLDSFDRRCNQLSRRDLATSDQIRETKAVVRNAATLSAGDQITTRLASGKVVSKVETVYPAVPAAQSSHDLENTSLNGPRAVS